MRCVRGAIIALAAWTTSAMAAPYHLPGKGEDFRPPPPANLPGNYDPFQRPAPDRLPDAYVDGRPYWFGSPVGRTPWVQTPAGYVVQPLWSAELGARYFGSGGQTLWELFGNIPPFTTQLNSRLTYSGLTAHAGEAFGRFEHGTGLFVKGFVGGGVIPGGTLQDEDFPPAIIPYSSTDSDLRSGSLGYGAIDFGWAWRTGDFSLSFFAGYFHYYERLSAFGCTQTAGNPFICAPGDVAASTQVIRQETRFNAVRLGFGTEWRMTDRWKLTTDVAWLPYLHIDANDIHLLRVGVDLSGPIEQKGSEALINVQLEAILSYLLTANFSIGVGARYWRMEGKPGDVIISFPDFFFPIDLSGSFTTERWGAFVQASYKFGRLEP
jgi:hypothetical protein